MKANQMLDGMLKTVCPPWQSTSFNIVKQNRRDVDVVARALRKICELTFPVFALYQGEFIPIALDDEVITLKTSARNLSHGD